MRAQDRASARKNIDRRLNLLMNADAFARPPRGWIRAIREALGFTTAQLAKRLSIAQPSAVGLEKAEASKAITLETIVQERARAKARDRLRTISHSMTLEDQRVSEDDEQAQLQRLAQQLIEGPGSALWDER